MLTLAKVSVIVQKKRSVKFVLLYSKYKNMHLKRHEYKKKISFRWTTLLNVHYKNNFYKRKKAIKSC